MKKLIKWIDLTLKQIIEARLTYYHWLHEEIGKGRKFPKWQPK